MNDQEFVLKTEKLDPGFVYDLDLPMENSKGMAYPVIPLLPHVNLDERIAEGWETNKIHQKSCWVKPDLDDKLELDERTALSELKLVPKAKNNSKKSKSVSPKAIQVSNDIRHQYPQMFANIVNCADPEMLYGFLQKFSFDNVKLREICPNNETYRLPVNVEFNGVAQICRFVDGIYAMTPDHAWNILSTQVVTNTAWGGCSKVILTKESSGTKMFSIPVEEWMPDCRTLSIEDISICEESSVSSGDSGETSDGGETPDSPHSSYDWVKEGAMCKAKPPSGMKRKNTRTAFCFQRTKIESPTSYKTKADFTFFLDPSKRIIGMTYSEYKPQ